MFPSRHRLGAAVQAPLSVCHCASPHREEAGCPTLVPSGGEAAAPGGVATQVLGPLSDRDSFIGQKFGSFQVVRELGRGGMGAVWLAEHTLIQKRVAVKVLHAHLAQEQRLVSRFLSEARTLTLIQHENVVMLYDLSLREGRPYLVMEYLEGQSLASFAKGPLEPMLAVELLSQVCDALGAAHAHGIVHRDLKPANVFLVPGSGGRHRVKLLDFGIAKLLTEPMGLTPTQNGTLLGTPEYMAPEQCSGGPVDARADLYAVGVMGYLLVTGTLPFTGHHPAELLLAHLIKAPRLAHEVRSEVPPALSQILARAMAKRPEDRFATAAELRQALRALVVPEPEKQPALTARVKVGGALGSAEVRCERVGRTGLFLYTEAPPPSLLVDVGLLLRLPGGELPCMGQVVRHVSAEQARQWNMAPGFGVQLRDSAPGFLETFERLRAGERVAPRTPPVSSALEEERVEGVLQRFASRLQGDHYRVLGATWDADFDTVRVNAREARLALEPLLKQPLSSGQRAQVERALERVAEAFHVLGHPERRAEYDASLRNFEGLQRCLAAGLTVTTLEECRRRFQARHHVPEGHAILHLATGNAFAAQGKLEEALRTYEVALRVDPLHLESLKCWRAMRVRLRGTASSS